MNGLTDRYDCNYFLDTDWNLRILVSHQRIVCVCDWYQPLQPLFAINNYVSLNIFVDAETIYLFSDLMLLFELSSSDFYYWLRGVWYTV